MTTPEVRVPPPLGFRRDGFPLWNLKDEQRVTLRLLVIRYLTWVAGGRDRDPWASGAAFATDYTKPRTSRHKPSRGYDAGNCVDDPPEPDRDLTTCDAAWLRLPTHHRRILTWHLAQGRSHEWIAEELGAGVTLYVARQEWHKASVRLWCAVYE